MDGSSSKAEVMKPVLLKAGIPLAISVAAFLYARIMARRSVISKASAVENQVSSIKTESCEELGDDDQSYHSLNSVSSSFEEGEEIITSTHFMNSLGVAGYEAKVDYEQEILGLRQQVEELQKREWETKRQLVRYHDLKEQESVLMELRNMLSLEKVYVEFLDREISFMEAENKRLENLVVEYLRVLGQLEYWKSQSGLLQRKINKLLRKTKEQSHIIREKNLKIEAAEAEIFRNSEELELRSNVIKQLEDEVRELQSVIDQLQEPKSELFCKLQSAVQSASSISKIEDEGITMEDYKQLANEYEQLQKDRAVEVKELIYLRWTNACLRHELMRSHTQQEQEQDQEKNNIMELEFEGCEEMGDYGIEHHLGGLVHGEPYLDVANGSNHACSKRPKFLQKLKRWVEGSEKMKSKFDEKAKHEIKCFGRHSVSDEAEEEHAVRARKSRSSA